MSPLKFDQDKVRLELIPPEFLWATGRGLTYGARKYAPGNWCVGDGFDWSRLYGGLQRHLVAWASGEDLDPESGNNHLDHACCMLAFLVAHVQRKHGKDDRQKTGMSHLPKVLAASEQQPGDVLAMGVQGTGRPRMPDAFGPSAAGAAGHSTIKAHNN